MPLDESIKLVLEITFPSTFFFYIFWRKFFSYDCVCRDGHCSVGQADRQTKERTITSKRRFSFKTLDSHVGWCLVVKHANTHTHTNSYSHTHIYIFTHALLRFPEDVYATQPDFFSDDANVECKKLIKLSKKKLNKIYLKSLGD